MPKSKNIRAQYPPIFKKIRNVILFIFDYRCYICHTVDFSNHVHHLDSDITNSDPFNLVPLCSDCHKNVHSGLHLHIIEYSETQKYLLQNLSDLMRESII